MIAERRKTSFSDLRSTATRRGGAGPSRAHPPPAKRGSVPLERTDATSASLPFHAHIDFVRRPSERVARVNAPESAPAAPSTPQCRNIETQNISPRQQIGCVYLRNGAFSFALYLFDGAAKKKGKPHHPLQVTTLKRLKRVDSVTERGSFACDQKRRIKVRARPRTDRPARRRT